ncbi:bifunctional 3-dehydroquinate dehydratase/shikimate dehydrogenase [Chlamydia gallinacea]|uniref:shikimate dehydrogenase (NADP(+)) n=2 Tax=Chlamydia gallinacea TaxID=1457153 RepID=A0A173DY07_9CHLA|nr:bifunctional 3-dehydroquinate dehydratase/shikimate dehydrogenase [Chlamydia gallinacea]EYE60876.1 shikimate 5-dehydrogenase [Bacteroides fragilis str. S6L5]ANG65806.1 shikimate dehydrogenase [Chlamydia gallinacea 08-1274/3]AQT77136.1 shikimate dehydrogenase [Chlamydia gallinacea]MBX6680362.1 bifunctional 3-dehydroquinate dehydratase/shikimate dehydrogenase [Chlamydia gallinacea]MBX6687516.1 bifunctional 3-dehydroquinate dehydratase/shikimate dehydrogenase [Chlamydia gallinacea]
MLCATISGPSFKEAQQQILHSLPFVDSIELRIDYLLSLSEEEIHELIILAKHPILTLKRLAHTPQEVWVQQVMNLARLQPEYLDIDYTFPKEALNHIRKYYPKIKILLSFHSDTYEHLPTIYKNLAQTPAHEYKLAISPRNSLETFHCLQYKNHLPENTTLLCMGEVGIPSRILSPLIKNKKNYTAAPYSSPVAPGQLPLKELLTYNYANLSEKSQIYGLIGNPIDRSISHISHNQLFANLHLSASYIKILLEFHELEAFISLSRELPFRGLSVTTPFKTEIINYIDVLDPSVHQCQACNTLVFKNNTLIGYNTDGLGMIHLLNAKGISLKNSRLGIVGAGGAAKAIALACAHAGANISIFNRSSTPGIQLANLCGGSFFPLNELSPTQAIDILILCLPPNTPFPEIFPPIILDINTLPKESTYTKKAKHRGCYILYGYELFAQQALLQFALWLPTPLSQHQHDEFLIHIENIMHSV